MAPVTKRQIREVMKALSKKGARKGGKARQAGMTADQRRELGKKAAAARWNKDE